MATDVFDAIGDGDEGQLRHVLADDPASAGARDGAGVSAVLHALYRHRLDLAEAVLDARPPLDVFELAALGRGEELAALVEDQPELARAWSADGFTALHLAAFFAWPESVAVLLAAGSDPSAVARNPSGVQPLHSALAGRDRQVVTRLLEAGVDPDATQNGGWTALHAAALHGDTPLVELLLARGARPDVVADDGSRPVDLARRAHHDDTAALLE